MKGLVSFKEFYFILDTLAINFPQDHTKQMFDTMDGDKDGYITYQDFINLKEMSKLESHEAKKYQFGSPPKIKDPLTKMADDVI